MAVSEFRSERQVPIPPADRRALREVTPSVTAEQTAPAPRDPVLTEEEWTRLLIDAALHRPLPPGTPAHIVERYARVLAQMAAIRKQGGVIEFPPEIAGAT